MKNVFHLLKKKFFRQLCKYLNTIYLPINSIDKHSTIGNHTYIGRNCCISKATIGRYTSIANNVSIGQGEHDLDEISTSSIFYEGDVYERLTQKDCVIGNDVWIGVSSIVRRGVTIGDGAIIGANSFVNKDVPPFAIVGGTPARILRYRFSEEKIKKIQDAQWWVHDVGTAKEIIARLSNEE